MFSSIISVLALAAAVCAKSIPIAVGMDGITFTPNSTTADVGDMLEFHFYPGTGPHSVVMGMLDSPCTPMSGGFFSSLIMGDSAGDDTYIIPVTSTDPIWYYCSARKHCQGGMVGVINPPSNATIKDYAAAAMSASSNVAPGTTMISGTYTTMPVSSMDTSMSMSMSVTGSTSMMATTTMASAATETSSKTSSTSTGGARQTGAAMGLMAAGGLVAAFIV